MKKFCYLLIVLSVSISTQAFAQDNQFDLSAQEISQGKSCAIISYLKDTWCNLFRKAPTDYVIEDQLLSSYMYKDIYQNQDKEQENRLLVSYMYRK